MQVLGINGGNDPQTDVEIFTDAFQLSFPILLDGSLTYQLYRQPGGTTPYPLDYIIDAQGNVAYHGTEYDPERMVEVLDELLGNMPALDLTPETLEFGAVALGESSELLLTVSNTGSGDLIIDSIHVDDPAFTVNQSSLLIQPGASRGVLVGFTPDGADVFADSLILRSNDPETPRRAVFLYGLGGDGTGVADFSPRNFRLDVSPNPFTPKTSIRFSLPDAGAVWLTVHDVQGRLVKRVLAGGRLPAGEHSAGWDGRDDDGRALASGIYFTRLRAGDRVLTRKVALLR